MQTQTGKGVFKKRFLGTFSSVLWDKIYKDNAENF